MRIALVSLVVVCACGNDPPPRTEMAVAPTATATVTATAAPTASASPSASSVPAQVPVAAASGSASADADAFGSGGLGLTGVGEGAGGRGEGIGLGSLGHGSGTGSATGRHPEHGAQLRQGVTAVNGRLPPEVIQRIVRQGFARVKLCYQAGLKRNPALEGRVTTKFVVALDGSVSSAQSTSQTTMTDMAVVSCVVASFRRLTFPQPEGGVVTVVYPLIFSPGSE